MPVKRVSHKSSTRTDDVPLPANVHVDTNTGKVNIWCDQRGQRMDMSLCEHRQCQSRPECHAYQEGVIAKAGYFAAQKGGPIMAEEIVEIECKYHFTDEETKEISAEMAKKITEKIEVEADKKNASDRFNKQIKELDSEIYARAARIHSGFEWRHMPCRMEKDYEKKIVRYIRTDNKEIAKERPMEGSDFEADLPIH